MFSLTDGQKMAENEREFDVIIVGGGPAGMSAAMWCAELGMSALILEKGAELGGQLLITHNPITNYLGIEAKNGRELRDTFVEHLRDRGFLSRVNANVSKLNLAGKSVSLHGGEVLNARAIILATGVRRRTLGIRGEIEFRGKGILESGSNADDAVAGKRVLIVGGGDAALENASILGEKAARVIVAHRRDKFRGRPEFIEAAAVRPNVEMLMSTAVQSISGSEIVEEIELKDLKTSETRTLPIDAVLIRVGVIPNTELLSEPGAIATGFLRLALDPNGYVIVDHTCKTSVAGIYAVGDVANPAAATINSAAGMGATAAKAIFAWLNA